MRKRTLVLVLLGALLTSSLVGCGNKEEGKSVAEGTAVPGGGDGKAAPTAAPAMQANPGAGDGGLGSKSK